MWIKRSIIFLFTFCSCLYKGLSFMIKLYIFHIQLWSWRVSHALFLFFIFLQLICELLALKNDVCSWLKKSNMVGVSQKSGEKLMHCRAQSSPDCFQRASCVSTNSPVALPRNPADLPAPAGGDQPAGAAPRRTGSLCGGIEHIQPVEEPEGGNRVAGMNVCLLLLCRFGRSSKSFASSYGGEAPKSTWASLCPSQFFIHFQTTKKILWNKADDLLSHFPRPRRAGKEAGWRWTEDGGVRQAGSSNFLPPFSDGVPPQILPSCLRRVSPSCRRPAACPTCSSPCVSEALFSPWPTSVKRGEPLRDFGLLISFPS